jgi:hypothetical protein
LIKILFDVFPVAFLRRMKKWLIVSSFFLFLLPGNGFGAENATAEDDFSIAGTLLVRSSHIWRGIPVSMDYCFEPELTVSKGNWAFTSWAARSFDGNYNEFDLILSWKIPFVELTLYDYYNPVRGETNRFLQWNGDQQRHSMEASAEISAIDHFSLFGATFLTGDNDETGRPFYSTYIEGRWEQTVHKINFQFFAGMTPFKGYYASEASWLNLGAKGEYAVSVGKKLKMPVEVAWHYNPAIRQHFLVWSLGLTGW